MNYRTLYRKRIVDSLLNFSFEDNCLNRCSVKKKTIQNRALGKSKNHYNSDVEIMQTSEDI